MYIANDNVFVRFEVLVLITMNSNVFWDAMTCSVF